MLLLLVVQRFDDDDDTLLCGGDRLGLQQKDPVTRVLMIAV